MQEGKVVSDYDTISMLHLSIGPRSLRRDGVGRPQIDAASYPQ